MSFTRVVKEEIWANLPKKPCCRRAFLQAILSFRGRVHGAEIRIPVVDDWMIQILTKLVAEQFSRECRLLPRENAVGQETLCFSSTSAASYIQNFNSFLQAITSVEKCAACRRCFLCGCFFAVGRIVDPQKSYLLEFSCGENRQAFLAFLAEFGWHAKISDRRTERLLYFRDSTVIEEFFAYIGATQATFALMDQKIERGMRNEANRLANCDANNIDKTVAAAMRLNELIEQLIEQGKLSSLPPELESTARLRLQYPDMSLGQLAAMAEPPMTKSGLNHRLKKIRELADAWLNEK